MGFTFVVFNSGFVGSGRLAYNSYCSEKLCAFVRKVLIVVSLYHIDVEKVGTFCRLEYIVMPADNWFIKFVNSEY